MKDQIKHTIFLFLLLSTLKSIIAQNLKLSIKPDSIFYYLEASKVKKSFISKKKIIKYLDSVSNDLNFIGFLHNSYKLTESDSVFTASYELNSKIDFIQIYFNNKDIDFSKIASSIKILNPDQLEIPTKNIQLFLKEVSNYFEKLGNSFTEVSLINLSLINSKIHADLYIKTSAKRHFDDIVIKGYPEISKKQLKSILQIKSKKNFNIESLDDIEKTINTISFIDQIKKPEVLFTKDSTFLYLYIKKKTINRINGIIGFSTSDKNKLVLNGDLDLLLSNIFNKGEKFGLNWKSYDNNSTLRTNIYLPIVFTPKVSFTGNFNLTKQDTLYTTLQGNLNVIYNINKHHSIGGLAEFEKSSLTNIKPQETLNNYKKNGFGLTYTFSSKQSQSIFPLQISLSYIKGLKNNDDNLEKFNLAIENTLNFNYKNKLYLRLKGQFLNSTNLFENELFKIGGYKSLRGFDELSIYTSKYILTNIEYRYHLNKKNFFYSITDFALTNNTKNLEKKSLLGIGVGYHFTTKNSILNFCYATRNTINKNKKSNISKVYLNISYLF